ncbi:hypothetical protein [Acetivibrio cellulolyticus]|uniref:hypothetical protein n=1 Tax=Acetivibrio cellulolyticus TaxID=35830 RepID=UPI0001E2E2C6|nr:hypothetical protein [Acetivibrio cellulolyticus]
MYSYNNRRQYVNKEPEKEIEKNIPESTENTNLTDLKSFTTNSINLLSENINEIKKSLKKLEDSFIDLALRVVSMENHIDTLDKLRNIQNPTEYKVIDTRPETPNKNLPNNSEVYKHEDTTNLPMMPGSGFANITAEYLKNLNKNK